MCGQRWLLSFRTPLPFSPRNERRISQQRSVSTDFLYLTAAGITLSGHFHMERRRPFSKLVFVLLGSGPHRISSECSLNSRNVITAFK